MFGRIRILFLSANPVDMINTLHSDVEIREIEDAILDSRYGNAFELFSKWAVRPPDLKRALLAYCPHIVHFSGHGLAQGIFLVDDFGNRSMISKEALVELLSIGRENIRIVFLNLCHSIPQIELLNETVDFIIGMTAEIGDKASIVFASNFYRYLANGHSVKEAFESAKEILDVQCASESSIPKLFIRNGVNDSESFLKRTMNNRLIYLIEE